MKQLSLAAFFIFLIVFMADDALPCSMFKITLYGKTMVGNNEDAWRLNSRIWFENGKEGHFGAAYVGHDDGFPQGGFNEAGLAYDGFTVYRRTLRPGMGKLKIEDTTLAGHEEKYVLSNFCPSLTPDPEQVKIDRYQRGRAFLQNKADTSLQFCLSVMDTMHECRARQGDGTLILIRLFFLLALPCCGLIYLRELRRGAKTAARSKTSAVWPLLLAINLGLAYYLYQLLSNKTIFYFDAPYKEEGNWMLNLSSWFPLSLLLLFLPVGFLVFRAVRQSQWNKFYLSLSILNLTSYILLLVLFGYWGLYL